MIEVLGMDTSTYKSDMADMLALHDHRAAQASRVDDAMSADLELTQTEKKFLKKRIRELKKDYPDASTETLEGMANMAFNRSCTGGDQTAVRGTGESVEDARKYTTAGRRRRQDLGYSQKRNPYF